MPKAMSAPVSPPKPGPAVPIAQADAFLTRPGPPLQVEEALVRGVKTRVWKNAPPTLREVFVQGRTHGDKIFLVYENDRASFDAFSKAALAIAEELIKHGVKKGDRVVLAMRNLPEWAAAF